MKKQLYIFIILLFSTLLFSACPAQAPDGSSPNTTQSVPKDVTCEDAFLYRYPELNQIGQSFDIRCPSDCKGHSVWGTDTYTPESNACIAAAHSGFIETSSGGVVHIDVVKSLPFYTGSTRNNITTEDWENTTVPTAFTASKVNSSKTTEPVQTAQPVSNDVPFNTTCAKASLASFDELNKELNKVGITFKVNCPANCPDSPVWGSDTYTLDSNICIAGVHSGIIESSKGGVVSVTVVKGLNNYTGSTRNGITTHDYGAFGETAYTLATESAKKSSILPVTKATTPPINEPTPPTNQPGEIVLGEYACYGVDSRLMTGMGFILNAGGSYQDLDGGRSGNYVFNSQASEISFNGGFLGGQTGHDVDETGFDLSETVSCEPW